MAFQSTAVPGSGYGNPYIDSLIWGCQWTGGPVTYAFGPGSLTPHGLVSQTWTATEQEMFREVLALFSNVCGITFAEVPYSTSANIVEWKVGTIPGASPGSIILGYHDVPNGSYSQNWGVFSTNGSHWSTTPGSLGFSTVIHELGHGLGLAHPHDGGSEGDATRFPGVVNPSSYGEHDMNQSIWSVMSYNLGWKEAPLTSWSHGSVLTPMALDIAALQQLYGVNTTFNTGDNNYRLPGANVAGTGWSCLWDAAGTDTISNEGSFLAATIDLRAAELVGANAGGYVSRVAGIVGGFTIANGVIVENATGGIGNDILIGNEHDNILDGGAGNDVITGSRGTDIIKGGVGSDTLVLSGHIAQYLFDLYVPTGSYFIKDLIADRDGTDWLESIEQFYFAQTDVLVSKSALLNNRVPDVTWFSPAESAVNVSATSSIVVTFSEAIQRGIGTIEIRSGSPDGPLFRSYDIASSNKIYIYDNSLTIYLAGKLAGDTHYFVVFSDGAIRDLIGTHYAGTDTLDFITSETIAPTVMEFSPADDAVNVEVASNIVVAFSEAVQRGTGTIKIMKYSATSPNSTVESFDVASSDRLDFTDNVLTIDPTLLLSGSTRYFVWITSGSIQDMVGNSYEGTLVYDFTTAHSVTEVVFDGNSDGMDLGFYKMSSGSYAIAETGLAVGESAFETVQLMSGTKTWVPAKGSSFLAVELVGDIFSVIYSTGSAARKVYSSWSFDADTGLAAAKPMVLSLTQLLAREVALGIDLNGDAVIGDGISAALFSGGDHGLYRLSSGGYVIAESGLAVSDFPGAALVLLASGKNWAPPAGASILSVAPDDDNYKVIYSVGTGTKKVFSSLAFNSDTGSVAGKAVTFNLAQVLVQEAALGVDLNGDSVIGDGIAAVLLTNTEFGVYRLSSAGLVIAESGLSVGDTATDALVLLASGKNWVPPSGASILSVTMDAGKYNIIYSVGTGTKKVFNTLSFNADTGSTAGKALKLTLAEILADEVESGLDLNGDESIGDAIAAVLHDGPDHGLYRLTSGTHVLAEDGMGVGDSADEALHLKVGSKVWAPASSASILAVELIAEQYSILYSTGSGNKKVYNSQAFNAESGLSAGKPVVLSLAQLLVKEVERGVDLNGDTVIGDGIAQVLYDGSSHGLDYGIYKLASGLHVIGVNGLPLGNGAADVLQLVIGSKPWTPVSRSTILAVESSDVSYSLIYSTGSGNKTVFSIQTFELLTGKGTGKGTALNSTQLLAKEESLGVDLNGDSVIGDGILGTATWLESDPVFGQLASLSSEPGYSYPSDVAAPDPGDVNVAIIAEQDIYQASWAYP